MPHNNFHPSFFFLHNLVIYILESSLKYVFFYLICEDDKSNGSLRVYIFIKGILTVLKYILIFPLESLKKRSFVEIWDKPLSTKLQKYIKSRYLLHLHCILKHITANRQNFPIFLLKIKSNKIITKFKISRVQ